ncbi:hypothetical protein HK405_004015 [Cladochytrium tenue]|nr:hypothetical protein HK405_004015 [Cladochytrium tenue]
MPSTPTTPTTSTPTVATGAGAQAAAAASAQGATAQYVSLRLTERSRSVQLEIPAFSRLGRGHAVSYGASPFLVGGRKWGLNVYPHGLRQAARTYGQLADIYVHLWARDANESEDEFLRFVRSHGIHFLITLTEPEPTALRATYSSHDIWSDMEDAAGWWHVSLDVPPQLLDLTNDTLIIVIDFQPAITNPSPTPTSSSLSTMQPLNSARGGVILNPLALAAASEKQNRPTGTNIRETERRRLYPAAHWDPAMKGLFDNPKVSDFEVVADGKPIFVQRCFLEAKMTPAAWSALLADVGPVNDTSQVRKKGAKPEPSSGAALIINDVPFDIVRAVLLFMYTGEFTLERNASTLGYTHVLAERFGLEDFRRFAGREIYRHIRAADAVELLRTFGGKSARLQEILVFFIVHNFAMLKELGSLDELALECMKEDGLNPAKRLLALLRRLEVASETSSKRASGLELYINEIDPPTSMHETGLLYVAADKYDIKDLERHAETLLIRQMTPSNVTDFLFGFAYKYEPLRRLAFPYLVREFNRVRVTAEFARVIANPHEYDDYATIVSELLRELVIKGYSQVDRCDLELGCVPPSPASTLPIASPTPEAAPERPDQDGLANEAVPNSRPQLSKSCDPGEHDSGSLSSTSATVIKASAATKVRSPTRSLEAVELFGDDAPQLPIPLPPALLTPSEGEEVWDDPLGGGDDPEEPEG